MTTPHNDDEPFDALLAGAMKSRPAPASVPGLARRAAAMARPKIVMNSARDRAINALAAVVIIAMIFAIVIINPFASSAAVTEAQSLSDDATILFIIAATIGVGVLLAIESCLRGQRTVVPYLRFSNRASVT
jgi:hypothetical protein